MFEDFSFAAVSGTQRHFYPDAMDEDISPNSSRSSSPFSDCSSRPSSGCYSIADLSSDFDRHSVQSHDYLRVPESELSDHPRPRRMSHSRTPLEQPRPIDRIGRRHQRSSNRLDRVAGLLNSLLEHDALLPPIVISNSNHHSLLHPSPQGVSALPTSPISIPRNRSLSPAASSYEDSDSDATGSLSQMYISNLQLHYRSLKDRSRKRNAVEKSVRMRGRKPAGKVQWCQKT